MFSNITEIDELVNRHVLYRQNCLNLIASENCSSLAVRNHLTSDFGNRYGCYSTADPANREYRGNKYIHEFEMKTQDLVKDVFGAAYADLRPIGGHIAGVASVLGLLSPHDLVLEIHLRDWGHGLVTLMREASHLQESIRLEFIPFDEDRAVDLPGLLRMIHDLKPKMIIFGGSGMLWPEPIAEIKEIASREGIILVHDSSHVNGLIAGGVFPNPLQQGVDVMIGSTHKSFPGPQGGFILTNDGEIYKKIGNTLGASLVTSHHLQRLPALAVAMLEMKAFGKEYGTQVIKNSQALGRYMEEDGFRVIGSARGYSQTHLILVDVSDFGSGLEISKQLEKANILCSDDFGQLDRELRIGTAEVTRNGMREGDMKFIADCFRRIIIEKEEPGQVAEDIRGFTEHYRDCLYALK
ncbi:aminotransferase class I/II-fold pyridoxal phosphate-dependent enzyme [Desulfosporosinus meridiei]|uniref:Glycine/serine hydroxymethyltransferase n=1 Tax=Desulfosporosinus meridiei (strain ATCC BAA-275 / DSM 13257 / KCTC 12902 / NCIMB 13706 / S10) TaxID=768704 RepID=J7ITN3_DESMD|nr:aminotransferase class I/II-fold pyridoxal phosphate-dependent enzyme [Desulfosporosinus meridiei]AFQ45227.1 glycine/serine hydroxymethyltransferase [Desulfosporosinus meridiei DSM 13257]